MDFGKLPDLSGLRFDLPADHPRTPVVLGGDPFPETFKLYLGGTGWSNASWVGKWYPPKTRQKDFLSQYARQFSSIELNTTHYRIPDRLTIQKWREAVPEGFLFCAKVPQIISHRRRLHQCERDVLEFCAAVSGFEEKLGPTFLQLPPDFGPEWLPRFRQFISAWPGDIPLMVEFRHPEWFGISAKAVDAWELMEQLGIGAVITDVAGRRDVLHMHLTTRTLMLRFVGNALHPTDFSRMADWATRIAEWRSRGLEKAILLLHQPDNERMPEFAEKAIPMLNQSLGLALPHPRRWDTAQQGSLF